MLLPVTSTARTSGLRAFHSPSPSALIPVLSIRRFSSPVDCDTARSRSVSTDVDISTEVRRGPAEPNHPQQALDAPSCLAKWHAEQDLQRETSLNGGITELLLPAALAAWWRCPNHLWIKPDRQPSTLLQDVIVKRLILGLVLRRGPTDHSTQLSRWIHTVNPISPFMQQSPSHLQNVRSNSSLIS